MVKIEVGVNYRLLNLQYGTYLTLYTSSHDDHTSIISQEYINKSNQLWMFEASDQDKVYFIKSVETDQYVSIPTGQVVEGLPLIPNFVPFGWHVVDEPNMVTSARIAPPANTNLYSEAFYGINPDHTMVELRAKAGDKNSQIWVLLKQQ